MMVIGDSIGVGIAQQLPGVRVQAIGGISAQAFDLHFIGTSDTTVISLGSNAGPDDEMHLRNIRSRVSGEVIWLLPPARARDVVLQIASERHDRVVDVRWSDATPVHIHPSVAGYRDLAHLVEGQVP